MKLPKRSVRAAGWSWWIAMWSVFFLGLSVLLIHATPRTADMTGVTITTEVRRIAGKDVICVIREDRANRSRSLAC